MGMTIKTEATIEDLYRVLVEAIDQQVTDPRHIGLAV